jgi:predicted short-subunit dehydrogenase-like oxidoreductase (DUF2520 family)
LVAAVRGFLAHDVGIWLTGPKAQALFERAHLQDDQIRVGPVPDRVRRSCRFLVSVTGRPALPASGVAELVRRCSAPDVAAVHVHGATADVACHSSWAVNRLRRWTQGPVRLADPGAVAFGAVEHCSGEELGMTEVDHEADLAW